MKYVSTRGLEKGLSFEDVLFAGYAKDGGLYFPESIPTISEDEKASWSRLSFQDLAVEVLKKFIDSDEIPHEEMEQLVASAYKKFSTDEVVQFAQLKDGLNVAELFHGPTLAFKDLSLTIVGQLINYFLMKRKKHMIILVGTSGDTGSAAIHSVRGLPWVDIIVLFPKNRCSKFQQLQMTTVLDENVHLFAVDGSSDDLDVPIKSVLTDTVFSNQFNLCSVNSINWGRVLAQTVHFIFCYFRTIETLDERNFSRQVEIAVPTGACGNLTAGMICHQMGFPIRLAACVNSNDLVHVMLEKAEFRQDYPEVKKTRSPAMDILAPYNVERLLLLSSAFDFEFVKEIMERYEKDSKSGVTVPDNIHNALKGVITDSISVDDKTILDTMTKCLRENSYMICPHTATAVHYHHTQGPTFPRVCIATASPWKFSEALAESGADVELPQTLAELFSKEERYEDMMKNQDWELMLRNKITDIAKMRKQ